MADDSIDERARVIILSSLGVTPIGRSVDLFAREAVELYKVPERNSFEDWQGNRRHHERRLQHQVRSKTKRCPQRRQ